MPGAQEKYVARKTFFARIRVFAPKDTTEHRWNIFPTQGGDQYAGL
jgi:hypothetical protein